MLPRDRTQDRVGAASSPIFFFYLPCPPHLTEPVLLLAESRARMLFLTLTASDLGSEPSSFLSSRSPTSNTIRK